jgi:PTS system mannitol-specific IIC component
MLALIAMSPSGALVANLCGYVVGVAVSAAVTGLLLKMDKTPDDEADMASALPSPGASSAAAADRVGVAHTEFGDQTIRNVVFACDAGMGSSVMAESILRTKLQKAALLDVTVKHVAVADLRDPADLFLTSAGLRDRVEATLAKQGIEAPVIGLENLLDGQAYSELVERIQKNNQGK